MTQSSSPRRIIRFGMYQCDLYSGEMHKNGIKVKISDQPFRLLAILLERPGDLVTRQDLRQRLWPAETFVGFDDALNTAVNKLRDALDDTAENPRFIETIPRHGYRFIGSVEPQNASPAAAPLAPQGTPADRHASSSYPASEMAASRLRRWALRALAGVAISSAAFAFWWYTPLPPPRITHIDQITLSARIDTPARPVPDSQHVFYMERDGDHWSLMRTALGGGDGQRIEVPTANAMALAVSPDSSTLLFASFAKRGGVNQLWTMPTSGGPPMRLGNAAVADATFTPGGSRISYSQGNTIWVMDSSGANAHKLADLPGPASWLAWSPDGRRLRFTMNPILDHDANSIWEITSDGENLRQMLPGWSHPASECCGAWTPDGRYYVFTSAHGGAMNLWALRERGSLWRRSPRGPFQLTFGPDTPLASAPGRGGHYVFFYNGVWHQEMQRLDLKSKELLSFLPNPHMDMGSYSRDGEWVTYLDDQTGSLLRSRANGADPIALAPANLNPSFPRWSPDGKWIAFGGQEPGKPGAVYVVSASGGDPEPLLDSELESRDADWSPDGKQLVISQRLGLEDSNGYELLLVDFATRRAEKIPGSDNLAMSRWSPDGRFISATTADQSQLKLWDVAARKWTVIARGTALGISVWSPDSRYLYFQDLLGKGEALSRYDVQARRVERVMDFSEALKSGVDRCALFGITPDGSPIIGFNRGAYDLFAASVAFP